MPASAAVTTRLRELSQALHDAQRPVRILRALAWPDQVRARFFAGGATELPEVVYEKPRFDVAVTSRRLRDLAARADGENEAERLIRETAESYALAAEMLGAAGTKRFWELSCQLYGRPQSVSCDGKTTNLALAEHFDRRCLGALSRGDKSARTVRRDRHGRGHRGRRAGAAPAHLLRRPRDQGRRRGRPRRDGGGGRRHGEAQPRHALLAP